MEKDFILYSKALSSPFGRDLLEPLVIRVSCLQTFSSFSPKILIQRPIPLRKNNFFRPVRKFGTDKKEILHYRCFIAALSLSKAHSPVTWTNLYLSTSSVITDFSPTDSDVTSGANANQNQNSLSSEIDSLA